MARAGGLVAVQPILCLPPATGELPAQGGIVVSSAAKPLPKPIEHAGHSYQQHVIRTYALDNQETSSDPEEDARPPSKSQGTPDAPSHSAADDAAKKLASKMAIGSEDLYELLELGEKRWHATADDIKKSFRRISLIYHPDKISHHGDEARANSETHFKAVRKAYDILSDKKKRAAYDSIDDVDDSIPSEKDATSSSTRFYEKFGACFGLNSRWSVSDRVPELGDDSTNLDEVHRFYDFWYSFKSWRDFSFDLEYDTDQAECREEKRWMERQNAKHVKAKKLEENARIRRLVDLSYKHDPRLMRLKKAARAKKDAQKEERRRKAEEAAKLAKEKEERERLDTERKAAEEKLRRAEAKKQKDAARQVVRKARQRLRAVGRELQVMESERGLVALERMCSEGTAESIEAVAEALSVLQSDAHGADQAQEILERALASPQQPVSHAGNVNVASENSTPQEGDDKTSGGDECEERVREQSLNGRENHSAANGQEGKHGDSPWTQEELSLLSKGVAKLPGGTRDRWNRLAEYIGTRSADEVLRKVSDSRPSKIKPGSKQHAVQPDTDANAFKRFQEKKKGKPVVPQKTANKASPARSAPSSGQPPNKLGFTPKQQALFESALKKFPKGYEGRWKKVAAAVGRTPEHCQERFDELIGFYSARKAVQQ